MTKEDKKLIDKLNHRLKSVAKKFGKDEALYTGIQADLKSIEGLKLTKSGYISLTTENPLAIKAAAANIQTPTTYMKEAVTEEYDEDKDIKTLKPKEVKDLVNTYYGKNRDFEEAMQRLYASNPGEGIRAIHMSYMDLIIDIHEAYVEDNGKLTEYHKKDIVDKIDKFKKDYKV